MEWYRCIAVSCNLHRTWSHLRHVKYSLYSRNKGDRRIYTIRVSVLQIRGWELKSKSVKVNLISNSTVRLVRPRNILVV